MGDGGGGHIFGAVQFRMVSLLLGNCTCSAPSWMFSPRCLRNSSSVAVVVDGLVSIFKADCRRLLPSTRLFSRQSRMAIQAIEDVMFFQDMNPRADILKELMTKFQEKPIKTV